MGGLASDDVPEEFADEVPEEVVSASTTDESDSTATVDLEYRTRGGSTDTIPLTLVKEDGDWKVDLDAMIEAPTDVPDAPDVPRRPRCARRPRRPRRRALG